jgi:hypothetical protein
MLCEINSRCLVRYCIYDYFPKNCSLFVPFSFWPTLDFALWPVWSFFTAKFFGHQELDCVSPEVFKMISLFMVYCYCLVTCILPNFETKSTSIASEYEEAGKFVQSAYVCVQVTREWITICEQCRYNRWADYAHFVIRIVGIYSKHF